LNAETLELTKYILRFGAVFFFVGALTLDLWFLFRFSHRDARAVFPGIEDLKGRNITLPAVALTLLAALLFTLPNQMARTLPEKLPTLSGMISGAVIYLLAALLLVVFTTLHARAPVSSLFHTSKTSLSAAAAKGVVYGIAAIPPTILITIATNELITRAGYMPQSQPVIQWLTDPQTPFSARVTIFVSAVIIAPLAEELIFRGILFPAVLRRKSWLFAAMLTGCIFSLIHFHPPSFLSIFVLSLFFCAGYSATGSLITPIVMHMVFNATATFFTLLV
jgi:membrane protease YdiL (CAAX protease family)